MHWLANHVKGPFDIIMLQETHSCPKNEKFWKFHIKTHFPSYQPIFIHGTRASRGVIILIKNAYSESIQNIDTCHSYIIIDLEINETQYTLLNIYGPNFEDQSTQTEFLECIYQSLKLKEERQIIIGEI